MGPFLLEAAMDDEDWVEKYREEFLKRAAQKELEERTLWRRSRYVLIVVAMGVACGVGTTFLWRLF
jgi:hypothetical protein